MTAPTPVAPGTIADCCANRANRFRATPEDPKHPERVHEKCGVCGRNHYRVRMNLARDLGYVRTPGEAPRRVGRARRLWTRFVTFLSSL